MTDPRSFATTEERDLRAALQYAVAQICMEEEMSDASAHMSSQAVAALSELVYQYSTTCLSNDLVSFARHANRRTITVDDVQLVARKDPDGLLTKLVAFAERSATRRESTGAKSSTTSTPGKKTAAINNNNASGVTPMTQRMKALQERLKKGIDSSDDSQTDTDVEMEEKDKRQASEPDRSPGAYNVDDSVDDLTKKGKENQTMQLQNAVDEDEVFASSEEEEKSGFAVRQRLKKAAFLPEGTKSGFSSDESEDMMFPYD